MSTRSRTYDRQDAFSLIVHALSITLGHVVRVAVSYRVLEIGSLFDVGIVAGAFGVLAAITAVPAGRWVDDGAKRQVAGLGGMLMFFASVGSLFASAVWHLTIAMALLGMGHVLVIVTVQGQMAGGRSQGHLDQRFAGFSVVAAIGQLSGPLLAGVAIASPVRILGTSQTSTAFALASCLAVAAIHLVRPLPHLRRATEGTGRSARRVGLLKVLSGEGVKPALLAGVAVLGVLDMLTAYMPAIGESKGMSPAVVGALLSVRAGAGLASRVALPLIIKAASRRSLLVSGMSFGSAAVLTIAFASRLWQFFVLLAIVGFALGICQPLIISSLAGLSPEGTQATALGLRQAIDRVSQVVLPIGFGILATAIGVNVIFLILGLMLASGASAIARVGGQRS